MKRMIISGILLIPAVITALLLDSCIYDAPGDRFYRTLWKSQEATLGTITLDFLCDGAVSVKSTSARFDDFGTYQSDGPTALLYDLSLIVADNLYELKEAHRTGDTRFLTIVHPASRETLVIPMLRLSAYED